jgi:glycosyltransferase involved in cell wall biosynthesis
MRVSIITPTLNSGQWMPQCVGSVLMQNTREVEVEHVVADGGSTDDTVEIAKAHGCVLAPRDPDDDIFTVINKATLHSTGHLVGYLGSDDMLLPGALLAAVRRYVASGRRWVTGAYWWIDEDMRPLGSIAAPPEWLTAEMMATIGWSFVHQQASFMERTMFEELGGYDPRIKAGGDYDFFVRAMELAPFAREPQALACFRRRANQMSMVHSDVAHDNDRLAVEHGPAEGWKRAAYRYGLKAMINARNPVWSYRKKRPLPEVDRTLDLG